MVDIELLKGSLSESSVEDFLSFINTKYGKDFRGYSRSFIGRRLLNFLDVMQLKNLDMLQKAIEQNSELIKDLESEFSIHYTEMFRNPGFFNSLRKKVFPFLATYPTLKIWHAGCSTGEEVYSLAILLDEVGLLRRTKIFASDKDSGVLEKAADAIFDASRMKEYTRNYFEAGGQTEFSNYYSSGYGSLKFFDKIRKSITFHQHDLVCDSPLQKFNLILCRNVLIYFNTELQNNVAGLLNNSLTNLGYLGLGATETLAFNEYKNDFSPIDKTWKIYRKVSLSEWQNCKN